MDLEDLDSARAKIISFEREVAESCGRGEVKGPVHFAEGNEAQLIKIFRGLSGSDYNTEYKYSRTGNDEDLRNSGAILISDEFNKSHLAPRGIKPQDWVFASYRSHAHALLKGIPPEILKEEILRGRSMHPWSPDYRFVTSAIVPGHIPQAVGVAMGLKRQGIKDTYVWAFCGDMAAQTGTFHESSVYAARNELPIIFVVEDNGVSVDTPTQTAWGLDRLVKNPLNGLSMRYVYNNAYKHQGVGREVGF